MVRIYEKVSMQPHKCNHNIQSTYNSGINKGAPATLVLKEGQHERDNGRAEQDDDQLVLELFKDQLPYGCGWLFGDDYGVG